MVRCAVIGELDMHAAASQRCAIELNRRNPSRNTVWVLDSDFIARRVITKCDLKAPPRARDAGIEMHHRAAQTDTQDPRCGNLVGQALNRSRIETINNSQFPPFGVDGMLT